MKWSINNQSIYMWMDFCFVLFYHQINNDDNQKIYKYHTDSVFIIKNCVECVIFIHYIKIKLSSLQLTGKILESILRLSSIFFSIVEIIPLENTTRHTHTHT